MEETDFGGIFHVFNRGVEKRDIFVDNVDRSRFADSLFLYNDARPVENSRVCGQTRLEDKDNRDRMVDILAFVMMPNHFHLIVRPLVENGLTEFMRKMGTGYTNYFNIKHERVGPLFQGKFKSVLIEDEEYLTYLPFYIHFNPLDLIESNWKEREISDWERAAHFLLSYRWSSLADYCGQNYYSKTLNKEFLPSFDIDFSEEDLIRWLKDLDFSDLGHLSFE